MGLDTKDTLGGMHPVASLKDYHELVRLLYAEITPVNRKTRIPCENAPGRLIAECVRARLDLPRATRATFDGYAVRSQDIREACPEQPVSLKLIGDARPAKPFRGRLGRLEAVRVFTGASLPAGADCVAIVEHTSLKNGRVYVYKRFGPGEYLEPAASDVRRSQTLYLPGQRLQYFDAAILASQGLRTVSVFDRPRVRVIATGDEVTPAGARLLKNRVYDSDTPGVSAYLSGMGVAPLETVILPDDRKSIMRWIGRFCRSSDLVITIAGSSAGGEDYVEEAVSSLGRLLVHGVAISPGRPTIVAKVDDSWVLGIPGNPASCLAVCELVVSHVVSALTARVHTRPETSLKLAEGLKLTEKLTYFRPVSIEGGYAHPKYKGSGAVTSFLGAQGYILEDGPRELSPEERVRVLLFDQPETSSLSAPATS